MAAAGVQGQQQMLLQASLMSHAAGASHIPVHNPISGFPFSAQELQQLQQQLHQQQQNLQTLQQMLLLHSGQLAPASIQSLLMQNQVRAGRSALPVY